MDRIQIALMAAGADVVAADVPTMHPHLEYIRNAILVPPDHPEEMARAIRFLMQDDALTQSICRQAHEDVKAYSWGCSAARIHAFVKAALANPKDRSVCACWIGVSKIQPAIQR